MREKIYRRQKPVKINREVEVKDQYDSNAFDRVDGKVILDAFERHYDKHMQFAVELLGSRLAIEAALKNLETSAQENMGIGVQMAEEATLHTLEQAYAIAVKVYAYQHVLGLCVDDDTRKEVIKGLTNLDRVSKSPVKPVSVGRSVQSQIDGIEDSLTGLIGKPGEEIKERRSGGVIRSSRANTPDPRAPPRRS